MGVERSRARMVWSVWVPRVWNVGEASLECWAQHVCRGDARKESAVRVSREVVAFGGEYCQWGLLFRTVRSP